MHQYLPHTQEDIAAMLERCGVATLDDLYADVPESLRLKKAYNLPKGLSEKEIRDFFHDLDKKNQNLVNFAGAGYYDHYTPAVIPNLLSRSEFLTAYTPYQPEISQGTLQYIFEYQSMMTRLTGLPVSNASMYDGATATAEAMMMCVAAARKKNRVLVSATINPAVMAVCRTYARYHKIDLEAIPATADGVTDRAALESLLAKGDVAGVISAIPNYYGIVEDYDGWADMIHKVKASWVINGVASAYSVLKTPGEWGADIAVGDGQSLGLPLNYGGPYLGYMCVTNALIRKMPGRIVGATVDDKGQRSFVLTLQAREQHIRREKATSNICSNQGLMTLYVTMYMALMGPQGLREVNSISAAAAHRLADGLVATGKLEYAFPKMPYLNEVALRPAQGTDLKALYDACVKEGILPGVITADGLLLVCATEMQTPKDIDRYIDIVKNL